jgi:hypothetical protein
MPPASILLPAALRRALRPVYHFFLKRYWQSDYAFTRRIYRQTFGRFPDLEHPTTISEKTHWRMLHDCNPLFAVCTDKYRVRSWVAERGAAEYLVPLLLVTDDADSIDFDSLPRQFVIKTNNGSRRNVLVWDKDTLDRRATIEQLKRWLRSNYYYDIRERQYKTIEPLVLVEELLADAGVLPMEFRSFCFDGEPKFVEVVAGRGTSQVTVDYYDQDWKYWPVLHKNLANSGPQPRPQQLDEMLQLDRRLSAGLDFVRVDLYLVKGRVYFGEMTFTPSAGLITFSPPDFDEILGRAWKLPAGPYPHAAIRPRGAAPRRWPRAR